MFSGTSLAHAPKRYLTKGYFREFLSIANCNRARVKVRCASNFVALTDLGHQF